MPLLPANPAQAAIWAVIILFIVAYVAGAWLNRSRSKSVSQWIQGGLNRLGKQAKWQRVGSSGGQVSIAEASRPFRQVVISYYLLTREFIPLWAFERLQGKHDLLALRGELRTEPGGEIEVVPSKGRLRDLVDSKAGETPWRWHDGPAGMAIAMRGSVEKAPGQNLLRFLDRHGEHIQRLSIHPRKPNVMLFMSVSALEGERALDLFRDLQDAVSA